MAKISAGILSTPRGKVAGVVGSSWKGQGYIREKVIPANPNTVAQQAQRSKMKNVVAFAQKILATILIPFVSPFQKRQSGYNWFVKQNINLFTSEIPTADGLKLTAGTLALPSVEVDNSSATLTAAFTVTENPAGDGETLTAHVAIVDQNTGAVYFGQGAYTGTTATVSVVRPEVLSASAQSVYVFNSLDKAGLSARDVSTSFAVEDY